MIKNLRFKIKKHIEIIALISLIILTAASTSYFNYQKKINKENYNSFQ